MLVAVIASVPPTIAALAAWRGGWGVPAKLERVEAILEDLLDWQVDHDRQHKANVTPIRPRRGGMQ